MCYIIVKRLRYYGKILLKITIILAIATLIVVAILLRKFKPVYKVTLGGEVIGYVDNKELMEEKIYDYKNTLEGNVVSIEIPKKIEYELEFSSDIEDTSGDDVLLAIKDSSDVTCKVYAIKIDDEVKSEVNTKEEADKIVEDVKAGVTSDLDIQLTVEEEIKNKKDVDNTVKTSEVAMATVNEDVTTKVDEYEKKKAEEEAEKARIEAEARAAAVVTSRSATSRTATNSTATTVDTSTIDSNFAGLFSTPVSGTITSKYGYRSSGFHTGLDIATATGTPIHAAASGTVTYAGWKGSYGNLVIIDHGNGYQTYYAHCSAIYVSAGQAVTTDTTISAVGSTGNSTGPHLHLEIRLNGQTQNPQNYLY